MTLNEMKTNLGNTNAFYNVSFDPRKRLERYISDFEAGYNEITKTCQEKGIEAEYYTNKFYDLSFKYLAATSRCASTAITGSSNFPFRKMEKYSKYADSHLRNLIDFKENLESSIDKHLRRLSPKETESNKKEKWLERIAILERDQETMKKANALLRKGKEAEAFEIMNDKMKEHILFLKRQFPLMAPNFTGYKMQNNLANIKRIKANVAQIERMQESDSKEIEADGYKIAYDNEELRYNIYFDDIPPAETRGKLKSRGFKWSPKRKAWTRSAKTISLKTVKSLLD